MKVFNSPYGIEVETPLLDLNHVPILPIILANLDLLTVEGNKSF